jgi:hypothetical protein
VTRGAAALAFASLAAVALLATACDSTCASGREDRADPAGRACNFDGDCEVECSCVTDDGETSVLAGACHGGICHRADAVCFDACRPLVFEGEFCAPP